MFKEFKTRSEIEDFIASIEVGTTFVFWRNYKKEAAFATLINKNGNVFFTPKTPYTNWVPTWNLFNIMHMSMYFSIEFEEWMCESNPIIRKVKSLDRRFKSKTLTKTKMQPLPFPKGV